MQWGAVEFQILQRTGSGGLQVTGSASWCHCNLCTLLVSVFFLPKIICEKCKRQFKVACKPLGCKKIEKGQTGKVPGVMSNNKWSWSSGPRLQHRAIFHSPPPDRIRLGMPTQSLKYAWDDRTHHYNEHLSPKMSHLEFDYFVSKIGFSGSDQVNFTICFSWLNCWLFLQAAPKPLHAVCAARSAVGGKSLQSFTGVSPSRTESTLASVARISPQVQRRSASVYNKTTIRNPNWTQVWFIF